MAKLPERPVSLLGRQLMIMIGLVDVELEAHGVDVPPRRLSEAREVLAGASLQELENLRQRLATGLTALWAGTDEECDGAGGEPDAPAPTT